MKPLGLIVTMVAGLLDLSAAPIRPAPQAFSQESARHFSESDGLPKAAVQCLDLSPTGAVRVFAAGQWFLFDKGHWREDAPLKPRRPEEFTFSGSQGDVIRVAVPWADVRQIVRYGSTNILATASGLFAVTGGNLSSLRWPNGSRIHQIAVAPNGAVGVASSSGLFHQRSGGWEPLVVSDALGRSWSSQGVLAVSYGPDGRLWFATRAGVVRETADGWQFYEGKDGLPWNEFTGMSTGPGGEAWFGTHRGAIRFQNGEWHYRQGPLWLPHDDISTLRVDAQGNAWCVTSNGVALIEFKPMTLAEKAALYEREIEQFIQRTPLGYVAEAPLRIHGERSSANPQDSDNDGLWTAMWGAGACLAGAAPHPPNAKAPPRKAVGARRLLQKVTPGGSNSPPTGYVARTIRPVEWPDPNVGRLEQDRADQKSDALWKAYEPRWPKSADGQWFWKSDTSSDELDGHYFFYPLYYDFCADTDAERARVQEVVRDLTDHLLTHNFVLIDHDGRPTRWAVFGPQFLNQDPRWWPERGLNSLSILSYLAVAAHITGDAKYDAAARELIEQHGYAHNLMYPKIQHGPGSGNQSDDEMAFMCYYNVLRYSKDERLRAMARFSFFRYWVNEAPETNPFFNFAYAAQNLDATITNVWGAVDLRPWPGWHEDAMATLYGFPLDRLSWAHQNSHRLDIVTLPRVGSQDVENPDRVPRGQRVNGKVVPVENRHFGHWNTDPWRLDYGGSGDELGAGTVFLLPYYLGLYHGFIQTP